MIKLCLKFIIRYDETSVLRKVLEVNKIGNLHFKMVHKYKLTKIFNLLIYMCVCKTVYQQCDDAVKNICVKYRYKLFFCYFPLQNQSQ